MNLILNLLLVVTLLTSCQSKKQDDESIVPAEQSYEKGLKALERGKFHDASEEFGKVYFQHPGGPITPYAELMEAYSLYKDKKYLDAGDVLDNFAAIHPLHIDMAYALYLKSLCFYMQISDIHHDQDITQKAGESFMELINRYPSSEYAKDAKSKLILVNDHLAGKEMDIGRYYQKRLNIIGAISRFSAVVRSYQTTSHIPEALYRLAESYHALGLDEEAAKYIDLVAHNYPGTSWDKHAQNLVNLRESARKSS